MTKYLWVIVKYNQDKEDWFPVAGVSFKTKKEAERFLEYEYNCIDNDIKNAVTYLPVKYRSVKYLLGGR